jgi:hypothetical protein
MQSLGGVLSELPQIISQFDHSASLTFPVEQLALWDVDAQHVLKAHRLSTQLDSVCSIFLGLAAFVFDGRNLPEVEWGMRV